MRYIECPSPVNCTCNCENVWGFFIFVQKAWEIARVVTDLGSLAVIVPLLLIFAGLLIWRRRLFELAVLVTGFVLTYAGVHITKAAIDRPRPAEPLDEITGSSFPSGHAAYAITYVAMAVIAARVLPGFASRAVLVFAAIVVAAVVGLTRVYLRAHYWSDVVGGWALGAGVFGAVAALALLVSYIRHNGGAGWTCPIPAALRSSSPSRGRSCWPRTSA